ncbi:hypothetical protein I0C86_10855 [Plantactinospora sp. S1510]|uniref:Band 7 domain-containing protein n=1 Tax=Plantactinospora alkalitolerans TaxID=2789879 RepID=A0ABS0GTU5_9ACTN|nr:hypothetical protein [Plantactinospora alkalitolerans]MBF9129464.1 hypothetical protein [Plantactinospora alkalitolerans]
MTEIVNTWQASPYPVVEHRSLNPPPKRGPMGLGRRFRQLGEVPRPQGHQVLVYRVDGQYVLDGDGLRLDDELVLTATHVSLIDMRRDAQVMVLLMIPSRDDSEFALQVTFSCTVTDAVTVVRDGVVDAEVLLRGYLKSHSKIFELGLDYALTQLNAVRRVATAQVRAYATVKPLIVPGLRVQLASVELLTPEEFRKLGADLRTQDMENRLTQERMRFEQERERIAREHEQSLEAQRREFERLMRQENDTPIVDPREAIWLAYTEGKLDTREMQQQLAELEDRKFTRDQQAEEMQREERRQQQAWDREKERLDIEARTRAAEVDAGNRQQERQWAREGQARAEQHARDNQIRQLDTKLEVLRELAKRGQLDWVNVNVDQLVADLVPTAAQISGAEVPALTDGPGRTDGGGQNRPERDADEAEMEAEVRDEDVD